MDNAIEKSTAAQYDKLIFEKSGTPSHLLCLGHYYEILKIDAELYDLPEVLTGIFGRLCCIV